MPAGMSPDTAADVDRVTEALGMITPRWSIRIVLALSGRPQRMADLRAELPQVSPSHLHAKLQALSDAGLVTRTEHSPSHVTYEQTPRVAELLSVLPLFVRWSETYLEAPDSEVGPLEQTEDALALLTRRHTAAILWTLKSRGPSSGRTLAALVLPHTSWTNIYPPLRQMLDDGLVDHEGIGSVYKLTEAGDALGPALAALSTWAAGRPASQAAAHPLWGRRAGNAGARARAVQVRRSAPPTTSAPPQWRSSALFSDTSLASQLAPAVAGGPRR
ncbi:winged helix-turn-helix transcriptional regulator [Streptomyces sp. GZWMJZ-114]|uniref:winged helix-turn-helix transcriptional regulator n=1 Tax=Streptomyces sp. GZWMJZ-114 TaxID=2494734 RepID=UPI001013149E|nr:winged helix-turn-helix transcriptional regulator [Streptomyces sp. GZWMJZ-114]